MFNNETNWMKRISLALVAFSSVALFLLGIMTHDTSSSTLITLGFFIFFIPNILQAISSYLKIVEIREEVKKRKAQEAKRREQEAKEWEEARMMEEVQLQGQQKVVKQKTSTAFNVRQIEKEREISGVKK
jgi:hypothetical protein